jgi:hypothetical protein
MHEAVRVIDAVKDVDVYIEQVRSSPSPPPSSPLFRALPLFVGPLRRAPGPSGHCPITHAHPRTGQAPHPYSLLGSLACRTWR